MVDTDKPAVPASRAVAMFAVVFAVLALIAVAAWSVGGSPEPTFCTADGRVDPSGQQLPWHRDPEQGCRWVDQDGNLVADQ